MYIDPFACGVAATILAEVGALIVYAILHNKKK